MESSVALSPHQVVDHCLLLRQLVSLVPQYQASGPSCRWCFLWESAIWRLSLRLRLDYQTYWRKEATTVEQCLSRRLSLPTIWRARYLAELQKRSQKLKLNTH